VAAEVGPRGGVAAFHAADLGSMTMFTHFTEGLSADHVPAHATGNRRFCVGDGCEVIAAYPHEIEALDHARRLNRERVAEEYRVYCCDLDERDDAGEFVYPHERAAAGL
jgi:hypothetical protein